MNFREASEIAKKEPGSVLTRDEYGEFIVQLPNGSVVSDPVSHGVGPEGTIQYLRAKLDRVLRERNELEIELKSERSKNFNLKAEVDHLAESRKTLEDKLQEVPDEVWMEIEAKKERIAAEKREKERRRLLELIQSKDLYYDQIQAILDRATQLGFSPEEREVITTALGNSEHRPSGQVSNSAVVVHSTNEWWNHGNDG